MSIKNNTTSLQDLLDAVNALPEAGGVELPELTNEGLASDLLSNKQLIDSDGNVITGTFSIDSELSAQDSLIVQIQTALQNKASASEPVLQTKTVTPTTSVQNVMPDSEYDGLSQVTVNPIPSTYVKPTSTKAATTYTPTTSNQTIAAGTYCSGVQTIKGDANLIPSNIVSGKSIFGVVGSAESGSGGGIVEYCAVQVSINEKAFDGPLSDMPTYYYTADNFNAETFTGDEGLFMVPKNTIIAIYNWSGASSVSESCVELFCMMGMAAYQITGDAQLEYNI